MRRHRDPARLKAECIIKFSRSTIIFHVQSSKNTVVGMVATHSNSHYCHREGKTYDGALQLYYSSRCGQSRKTIIAFRSSNFPLSAHLIFQKFYGRDDKIHTDGIFPVKRMDSTFIFLSSSFFLHHSSESSIGSNEVDLIPRTALHYCIEF